MYFDNSFISIAAADDYAQPFLNTNVSCIYPTGCNMYPNISNSDVNPFVAYLQSPQFLLIAVQNAVGSWLVVAVIFTIVFPLFILFLILVLCCKC